MSTRVLIEVASVLPGAAPIHLNGWWEMACHHLGQEPTEQEAPKIQFPIVKPGGR